MSTALHAELDRAAALRSPIAYPQDEAAFLAAGAWALPSQRSALAAVLAGAPERATMVAAVNASLGFHGLDQDGLAAMEEGRSIMPPRIALAVARVLGVPIAKVLPHVESMPWLGGVFRPSFAGREWISIARHFDGVPLLALSMARDCDVDADSAASSLDVATPQMGSPTPHVVETPSGIRSIIDRIAERVASRATSPVNGDVPHEEDDSSGFGGSVIVDPMIDAHSAGHVLMSMTAIAGGIRFVYRGVMSRDRLVVVEQVLGSSDRVLGLPHGMVVEELLDGHVLVACDVVVDADLGPALLSALGRRIERRRGLMTRLFGI